MLTCLAFCAHDAHLAKNLLRWICELGGCKNHKVLLLADCNQPWVSALEIHQLACEAFGNATLITTEEPFSGWPTASNWMWYTAAEHISKYLHEPFLWLEPDCVPLKPGWLNKISGEYQGGYLGQIYKFDNPNGPFAPIDVMSGIAVYPPTAFAQIGGIIKARPKQAWDVSACGPMVKGGTHTDLIHHFFGQHGLPPTFVSAKVNGSPVNAKTVAEIPPEAVLFHRNKDGSLMRLLRSKMGSGTRLSIVLPYCASDGSLLVKNLQWLKRLNGRIDRTAVLHFEADSDLRHKPLIDALAREVFSKVIYSQYQRGRHSGWPSACNWAFQNAARFMMKFPGPWLWYEADAFAVKKSWITQLEEEYAVGRKPFMGTIIENFDGLRMGHMNGVGIYPQNVGQYTKAAMTTVKQAWDTAWRDELGQARIGEIVHRANHLIQHCAAIEGGCCKPANGPLPVFHTQKHVDAFVKPSTVIFHPSKDGSLPDRLKERM